MPWLFVKETQSRIRILPSQSFASWNVGVNFVVYGCVRGGAFLQKATGPPRSGAGVGVGIFRGFMVSWESQRFKKLICQTYQDSTPIQPFEK